MGRKHTHTAIDFYAYHSGVREWNATYKTVFSVGALLTVIAADRMFVSVFTMCYMALLTLFFGRVHLHDYLGVLSVPLAFIFFGGLAIAIQTGNTENALYVLRLPGVTLSVSREGLLLAAATGIKALGAVSAMYFLTLSTPMGDILSVLQKMHVPGLIIDLMHLIYHYIFILLEFNRRQKDAAKARLGDKDWRTSIRTFGMELANLFLVSMKKSGAYFDAMEARGYEGACLFWEEKKPLQGVQLLAAVFYAVALAAGLAVISG